MLFSRLYNWIKYKTLPPSILFKNRLFVERDSKHRRVTSNLGLTFRNSKWSTYARVNVNLQSQSGYWKFLSPIVLLLSALIVLTKFSYYYDFALLFTPVYTLIWFLFDGDLYLKAVFTSSVLCTFQLLLSNTYNHLFSTLANEKFVHTNTDAYSPPKRLHKPFLYLWATNSSDGASILEQLNTSENGSSCVDSHLLLKQLYKSVHLLKSQSHSYYSLATTLSNLSSEGLGVNLLTSRGLSNRLLTLGLEYTLLKDQSNSRNVLNSELAIWSLSAIHNELAKQNLELTFAEGSFYLPTTTTSTLNKLTTGFKELGAVRVSVENQLQALRWHRWLYKFNLLHRKSLKSTSNLTYSKRLIGSGFHNSSSSNANLWAASTFSSNTLSSSAVSTLASSVYGSSNSQSWVPYTNAQYTNSLGFYEESYYWFIKRFYLFNSLDTNQIFLYPKISSQSNGLRSELTLRLANSQSTLDFYTASRLSPTYSVQTFSNSLSAHSTKLLPSESDIHLDYGAGSFFNQQNVETLLNLSSNSSSNVLNFYVNTGLSGSSFPKF